MAYINKTGHHGERAKESKENTSTEPVHQSKGRRTEYKIWKPFKVGIDASTGKSQDEIEDEIKHINLERKIPHRKQGGTHE